MKHCPHCGKFLLPLTETEGELFKIFGELNLPVTGNAEQLLKKITPLKPAFVLNSMMLGKSLVKFSKIYPEKISSRIVSGYRIWTIRKELQS